MAGPKKTQSAPYQHPSLEGESLSGREQPRRRTFPRGDSHLSRKSSRAKRGGKVSAW